MGGTDLNDKKNREMAKEEKVDRPASPPVREGEATSGQKGKKQH